MALREFFHLIHVVDDLAEADELYDRLFAPQWFMKHRWADHEARWASLGMIGDFMLETIKAGPNDQFPRKPLTRFHRRFGQHFHSLAWYVDDEAMQPFFRRLRAGGVRVAMPGGGFFPNGDIDPGITIFSHPKDLGGQLEFVKREIYERLDLRARPEEWKGVDWWRDEHPLGIVTMSHMTQVVRDVTRTATQYEQLLGGKLIHELRVPERTSIFVFVGDETIVELAEPTEADSLLRRDLAANGEITHGATFLVRDLDAVERHVVRLGITVASRAASTLALDPASTFGAPWSFTDERIPNDPRQP